MVAPDITGKSAEEAAEAPKNAWAEAERLLRRQVEERPLVSLGVALAAGLLIGALLNQPRR
ncbi:MAG: hypothetical protein AB7O04_00090 [Hyphomonadaceae bacterium]